MKSFYVTVAIHNSHHPQRLTHLPSPISAPSKRLDNAQSAARRTVVHAAAAPQWCPAPCILCPVAFTLYIYAMFCLSHNLTLGFLFFLFPSTLTYISVSPYIAWHLTIRYQGPEVCPCSVQCFSFIHKDLSVITIFSQ